MSTTNQQEQLLDLISGFMQGQVCRNRLGAVDTGEISDAAYARLHINGHLMALLCSFKDEASDWLVIRDRLNGHSIPLLEAETTKAITPQHLGHIILYGYLNRPVTDGALLISRISENKEIPLKKGHDIVFKFQANVERSAHLHEVIPTGQMAVALSERGIPLEDDRTCHGACAAVVH